MIDSMVFKLMVSGGGLTSLRFIVFLFARVVAGLACVVEVELRDDVCFCSPEEEVDAGEVRFDDGVAGEGEEEAFTSEHNNEVPFLTCSAVNSRAFRKD